MLQAALDIIGLQTPAGRLIFFAMASAAIYVLPQSLLGEFSLWARIGLENAPSVGLTRAYNHVLHGNLAAAWTRNSLIFVVIAVGLPLLVNDIARVIKQRRP